MKNPYRFIERPQGGSLVTQMVINGRQKQEVTLSKMLASGTRCSNIARPSSESKKHLKMKTMFKDLT